MELTSIQAKAVEEIYSHFSPVEKTRVDFKSPTGSGKTLMASWLISFIIERNPDENFIFVIATPSSSSLPFFFEQKINLYKKDLPYSKFEVEYIESPSSKTDAGLNEQTPKIKLVRNKVYIFGKSTFGAKRIFTEQHVIDDFVDEALNLGYKIVYIRDEAHIGDLRIDNESRQFESLMQSNSHFVIKMTATPNLKDTSVKIVVVKETDLNDPTKNENKWLLKTTPKVLLESTMSEEELLDNALKRFIKIKEKYKTLETNGVFIHPAVLVQVSNEPSDKEQKKAFLESVQKIKEKIDYYGLSWVQYFGDTNKDSNRVYKDHFSLDDITKMDNDIDVVLFKVGPSTGWDIPRACMLLQLRKVCSEQLNVQTLGRIKRNPFPGLMKNEITDVFYVYSNSPQVADDIIYYNFDTKNEHKKHIFPSIEITNKKEFKISAKKEEITKEVEKYLDENKNTLIQDIKNLFVFENEQAIFRNELYEANGSMVYSSITNPFVFLKLLRRLIDSKNDIYQLCKEGINGAYLSSFKNVEIYKGQTIKMEHLLFIVFHKYTKALQNIIKKCSPFTSAYRVTMTQYEPKQFIEIYSSIDKEGEVDSSDKTYMFNVVKNNKINDLIPLDSGSEKIVFDLLKTYIPVINEFIDNSIEVWCKNHVDSTVNSDYMDEAHAFHKSYFDFILKFSNGVYLYIEVKNKTDIDADKTQLLKDSYEDYFKSKMVNLYNVPIVLSVWTVEGSSIYTDTYFDSALFKDDLKNLGPKDLIKTIAKFKKAE